MNVAGSSHNRFIIAHNVFLQESYIVLRDVSGILL
jgi:hypothetical protein